MRGTTRMCRSCAGVLIMVAAFAAQACGSAPSSQPDAGPDDSGTPDDVGRVVSAWLATGGYGLHFPNSATGAAEHIANLLDGNAAGTPAEGVLRFAVMAEDTSETEARLTWGIVEPVEAAASPLYRFATEPAPQTATGVRDTPDAGVGYFTRTANLVELPLQPPDGAPTSVLALDSQSDDKPFMLVFGQVSGGHPFLSVGDQAMSEQQPIISRETLCHVWADGLNMLAVVSGGVADTESCTCPTNPAACPEYLRAILFVRDWVPISVIVQDARRAGEGGTR
jgi:hypothetical protein